MEIRAPQERGTRHHLEASVVSPQLPSLQGSGRVGGPDALSSKSPCSHTCLHVGQLSSCLRRVSCSAESFLELRVEPAAACVLGQSASAQPLSPSRK